MEIVGSYEEFKKLPIPAFIQILNGLDYKKKQEEKGMKKLGKYGIR